MASGRAHAGSSRAPVLVGSHPDRARHGAQPHQCSLPPGVRGPAGRSRVVHRRERAGTGGPRRHGDVLVHRSADHVAILREHPGHAPPARGARRPGHTPARIGAASCSHRGAATRVPGSRRARRGARNAISATRRTAIAPRGRARDGGRARVQREDLAANADPRTTSPRRSPREPRGALFELSRARRSATGS